MSKSRLPLPSQFAHQVRRARQLARENGLAGLGRYMLHRAGWRRVVLLEVDLERAPEDSGDVAVREVRPLEQKDLPAHARMRPEYSLPELRRRLSAGDVCLATWRGDRIVGSIWLGFGEIGIPAARLRLAEDELTVFDHFVAPAMRQFGIASVQSRAWIRFAHEAGYKRALYAVYTYNRPGLRTAFGAGPQQIGTAGSVALGPLTVAYVRRRGRGTRVWWGKTSTGARQLET